MNKNRFRQKFFWQKKPFWFFAWIFTSAILLPVETSVVYAKKSSSFSAKTAAASSLSSSLGNIFQTGVGGVMRPYQCANNQLTTIPEDLAKSIAAIKKKSTPKKKKSSSDRAKSWILQSDIHARCSPITVDDKNLTCDVIAPGGSLDAEYVKELQNEVETSKEGAECLVDEKDKLQAEKKCVNETLDAIENFITQVFIPMFKKSVQDAKKLLAPMQEEKKDRIAQAKEVNRRLDGDGQAFPGLIALNAELHANMTALAAEMNMVDQQVDKLLRDKAIFEEQKVRRIMALTVSGCLVSQNLDGADSCPNEQGVYVPASPIDAAVCRFERANWVGNDKKTIERDERTKRKAKSLATRFKNFLTGIVDLTPKNADIPSPKDTDKVVEFGNQSGVILTLDQLLAAINSGILKYTAPGIDLAGLLVTRATDCYNRSLATVNAELGAHSSKLGILKDEINRTEKQIKNENDERLSRYADFYSRGMFALTGQHFPLNLDQCHNTKPTTQRGCLKDIAKQLDYMERGVGLSPEMNLPLIAVNTQNTIQVDCLGVAGCIAFYANTKKRLADRVELIDRNTKDLSGKINDLALASIETAKAMLQPLTQTLQEEINGISSALADVLGIDGLDLKNIQLPKEKLLDKVDPETGLITGDVDLRALVLGGASPPTPDWKGNESIVDAAINKKTADAEKAIRMLDNAERKIASLAETCPGKETKKSYEEFLAKKNEFLREHCQYATGICDQDARDSLNELEKDLRALASKSDKLGGIAGLSQSQVSRLSTGFSDLCKEVSGTTSGPEKKEFDNLTAEIAKWKSVRDFVDRLKLCNSQRNDSDCEDSLPTVQIENAVESGDTQTFNNRKFTEAAVGNYSRSIDRKIDEAQKELDKNLLTLGEQNGEKCQTIVNDMIKEASFLESQKRYIDKSASSAKSKLKK